MTRSPTTLPRARGTTTPLPYRVVDRRPETPDTTTIIIEPVREALPPFSPGQFAMVYGFGVGDIPLSVSGIEGVRLTHTVRAVGAVSHCLGTVRTGTTVGVRGPYGVGWELPPAEGQDVLVVAGGLGLAPLRPLITAVLAAGTRRRVNVLVGARAPEEISYLRETEQWAAAGARVLVTVDRPDAAWQGDVGVVTGLLDRAVFAAGATRVFSGRALRSRWWSTRPAPGDRPRAGSTSWWPTTWT